MHRRLIEIFNLLNVTFDGRSILVVGDFHQLPPVCAMLLYASSLDEDHQKSLDLWRLISFAELTEVMRQRGDKHFIVILNTIRVRNLDSEVKRTLKWRIIRSSDLYYPKYSLHVFPENVPVINHSKIMLNIR